MTLSVLELDVKNDLDWEREKEKGGCVRQYEKQVKETDLKKTSCIAFHPFKAFSPSFVVSRYHSINKHHPRSFLGKFTSKWSIIVNWNWPVLICFTNSNYQIINSNQIKLLRALRDKHRQTWQIQNRLDDALVYQRSNWGIILSIAFSDEDSDTSIFSKASEYIF